MIPKGYYVKVTASGYFYILITIILSVGAVNTGNNLLYLMASLTLALMILSGIASFWNLFFLDVSLMPPKEVFAQIPARFRLIVNRKRGSSFFLSFETRFGSTRHSIVRGLSEKTLWLTFPKRGKASIETVRIHSGFPLGFIRRFKIFSAAVEIIVYPKPLIRFIPPLSGSSVTSEKGETSRGELSDEVRDIRDYRQSDPLKRVDWKATARRGEMMVRDYFYVEGDTLTIDLSRRGGAWEKRLSEACYMVVAGEKKSLSLSLILQDHRIDPGKGARHKRRLLEALALA